MPKDTELQILRDELRAALAEIELLWYEVKDLKRNQNNG